jgi:hypothetical protein
MNDKIEAFVTAHIYLLPDLYRHILYNMTCRISSMYVRQW